MRVHQYDSVKSPDQSVLSEGSVVEKQNQHGKSCLDIINRTKEAKLFDTGPGTQAYSVL